MKLNIDCIRDVLLVVEDQPFGGELKITSIFKQLSNYTEDELEYTCLKLYEAKYINAITMTTLGVSGPQIFAIQDLTYAGHQFLDTIRSHKVLEETKSKITDILGSASIEIISKVASSIATKLLGL